MTGRDWVESRGHGGNTILTAGGPMTIPKHYLKDIDHREPGGSRQGVPITSDSKHESLISFHFFERPGLVLSPQVLN